METPSGEQKKDMQKQLRTQPEKPIDNESSSEDDNVEELSNIESEEEAYDIVEDVEQSTESEEEGPAHASTQKTISLASNESFSEEDNIDELSAIESEEETYDVVENIEQQAESEEKAGHASMRGTKSLASRFMYSANYFKWSVTPPTEEETEADKVPDYESEVLSDAKNMDTPMDVWSLLFTDEMLSKIVKYTNAEMGRKRKTCKGKLLFQLLDINLEELKALIGIFYFCGLKKENSTNVKKLWKPDHETPIYRSTMTQIRFEYLMALLQFDDKSTRQERRQSDRLAPIRDLWDSFISNCTKYYSPGKNVTIGEQVVSFQGKCSFRVKMGPYHEQLGLRIVMMNDSDTYYMINAIPHVGKDDKRPQKSMPSYYVRKLSEPIYDSHRNITCNKRFTSVPLVQSMKNKCSLSMVGTIRAKEKEIPLEIKKFTEINDSRFLYADNVTLLSYCPKQNKIILVLSSSSLHKRGDAVVEKEQQIIEFYNSTKGGTDRFDQLCHEYSTARKSHRWVMKLFYAMLDQSFTNSYILHNLNKKNNTKLTKSEFLKTLAKQLYIPHIKRRLLHGKGFTEKFRKLMEGVIKGENSES
ncbi:piggyBac transposable element-derived protein 4-like [Temnothorax nylanderi]|uniref:piggyBac transposable element-derived protein 4-like n=1 Tax=Temnothorax nylanderi TaxID=102681 RepID=UPI003A8607E6